MKPGAERAVQCSEGVAFGCPNCAKRENALASHQPSHHQADKDHKIIGTLVT